ncbi:hypothetical protein OG571_47245 (plasmid) [Streptomyces sp. NBC_01369]|uniref:hypothetical protein n=1 Tax=Streptomyces sp. NBC_01369 TaxID=2903842 RepID=UPI002F90D807
MPAPPDDEFDQIIQNGYAVTEHLDTNPYGTPATGHARGQKPGLTKRGKVAISVGAAVIAGGSLIGYQVHTANTAAAEAKAQELQLKVKALELAELREKNRAAETGRTTEAGQAKARQASVDTCVKSNSDQIGKGFGSPSYRDIVDDCQAQYPDTETGDDMQVAASTKSTADSSSGGVNDGALLGVIALGAVFAFAVKKGARSNPA